ncbi:MAG: hypothetical protein AAFR65_08590 [Pseudomonadota bacterium]
MRKMNWDATYENERKCKSSALNKSHLTATEALDFGLARLAEEPSSDPEFYRRYWQGLLEYADQLAAERKRIVENAKHSGPAGDALGKLAEIDHRLRGLDSMLAASSAPANQAQEHAVRAVADKICHHLIAALADGQVSIFIRSADEKDIKLCTDDLRIRLCAFSPISSRATIVRSDSVVVGEIRVGLAELHKWLSGFLVPFFGTGGPKAQETAINAFFIRYIEQNSKLQPLTRATFVKTASKLAPTLSERGIGRCWDEIGKHFPELKRPGNNKVRSEHQAKHQSRLDARLRDLGIIT